MYLSERNGKRLIYSHVLYEVDLFAQTFVHGLFDGAEDVLVARAAAEVTGEQFAQLGIGIELSRVEDLCSGHDESGCAEAALDSGLINESLLDVGKLPIRSFQTFQCQDGLAFRPDSQVDAGVEGFPVDQNVAGAAFPDFTAFLDGSQMIFVAQHIGEGCPHIYHSFDVLAVDVAVNYLILAHLISPPAL